MNTGTIIVLCLWCLFVGFVIGDWKEGKAVSKAIDCLSAMHYKEIQMIINKILELRKDKKDGE